MNRLHFIPVLLVTVAVLLVTAGVRWWVEGNLRGGETLPLLGNMVRLTRGENSGIAFSLLENSPLVPWLSALALTGAFYFLVRALQHYHLGKVVLGLVAGGGLANLLDRIDDGYVTDYIDIGSGMWRFATFNLPDVAVVTGITLSVWLLARSKPVER